MALRNVGPERYQHGRGRSERKAQTGGADSVVKTAPILISAQGKPVEPESANESADPGTTQESKPPAKQEKEPMKRFTFDVPASLHRRVKKGCVDREIQMADLIREFLEKEFPA